MDSTSVNLLRRLREPKAENAWQRFVDLYAPLIFYWARQKGLNATDSADLVQDVLTTLVVRLPDFQYDPDRRFRGWLRTVTVNRANDLYRRKASRPEVGVEEALERMTVVNESDLFIEAEYRSVIVTRALELLRSEFAETTWQAGWLQIVEGRKAADVAGELGLPVNAVYLAKSRLLARLRTELEGLLD
jgi:RNA polymerase sigma-70 factor (ECF subfamily)